MTTRAMTVAGIMSGTSADGIDVAVVRIASRSHSSDKNKDVARVGHPTNLQIKLIAHEAFPYPRVLRRAVLGAMNAESMATAELARLNWRLGIAYAEAVEETLKRHKLKVDLAGCHGQTLYHQASADQYVGRRFACTWQLGEAQAIAQRIGVPVVSNFRPADMLAGGQGAPLVSLLDYVLFADLKRGRVLQNIGGIANMTAIPAGALPDALIAFDTGPGNMVIDWLAQELSGRPYDRNGAFAARGHIIEPVLRDTLRHRYFKLPPPRTAGREQFGADYAAEFLAMCRKRSKHGEDALATATALTAESIARSYEEYARPAMRGKPVDYIVSGGGARNRTLMKMLSARLGPLGCTMRDIDEFGLPAEAKEAAAFALLAWQTWHGLAGNVPAATGAARPVILGQVAYAGAALSGR
ncbi:MAG TPA: anhydro-N-acetylmuramic acid kinase [Terracidiphilus sp.]|nr:anhydro-N-acetylmuramic acid kinase [Terracidiphilus sp.]